MSSSGIDAINSGPLILRTYNNSSPNKTIVLENYDNPVPSNYVLITTSNGLLAPSNSIYISSVNTSTIFSVSSVVKSLLVSTSQISTLNVSTMSTNIGRVESLSISSINGVQYNPGVGGLWELYGTPANNMKNSNSGIVLINTPNLNISSANSTVISGLTNFINNVNINGNSTLINGALNVNGSTIISNYLSTNRIQMNTGGISSSGTLSLKSNGVYINGDTDGAANLHLFNNKTIISTSNTYNGCNIQLDNSGPNFNITNLNGTQTYASFTSTYNQLNNNLLVLAPSSISSSTHFLTIQNNYPGAGGAPQSNIVSQFNMGTLKGTYTWWLTDTQNPAGSGGLVSTHLQLYAYSYSSIKGGNKEIIDIAPTGSTIIKGDVRIGYGFDTVTETETPGNLSLNGNIITPSTISTPTINMTTIAGNQGRISGVSTINGVSYPPPIDGLVPIGGIIMWSGISPTLPTDWALCDGGTYGGQLTPDLRGRFIMGTTYATGTTRYNGSQLTSNTNDANGIPCPSYATNDNGGQQNVTLTSSQMPPHTHTYAQPNTTTQSYVLDTVAFSPAVLLSATINNATSVAGGTSGATEAHPNMPQYYVLAYIMRYK